jgi:SWIM zinc finger
MDWTTELVLKLAPDSLSAKAGKDFQELSKWNSMGKAGNFIWGEVQGSGSAYQTQIDSTEPAFKCTCPSRKFPCKHGLGLLLIYSQSSDAIQEALMPQWVSDWAEKRSKKPKIKAAQETDEGNEIREVGQAKRAAERSRRVEKGIDELELWLTDTVRQGLAHLQSQPESYWQHVSARMVDAQAPGIGKIIQSIANTSGTGEVWASKILEKMGSLQLLVSAVRNQNNFSLAIQNDVRSIIGYTESQEQLLTQKGIEDIWELKGEHHYQEDRLMVYRYWLWGNNTKQYALILDFVAVGQTKSVNLLSGLIEAELVYYPSNYPLRALIKRRKRLDRNNASIQSLAYETIDSLFDAFADALQRQPWLIAFPATLTRVTPVIVKHLQHESWILCDAQKKVIPISPQFKSHWKLLSLSGGSEMTIFGEWNGEHFLPLNAEHNNSLILF